MSILLQIAQLGNPVLRQKTELVTTIEDHDSQDLIDDMLDTLADVVGLGLAAPQVYRSLRLFIMACHPTPNYPAAPEMDPMAIINPEILSGWEGCLSIPGLRGKVPRHRSIEVTYFKQDGRKIQTKLTGMPPIIF